MEKILELVNDAQEKLNAKVNKLLEAQGKFKVEQYARFLTMQFYLTDDVQQEFYTMAGNHIFKNRKSIRKFMVKFAEEEEPHYLIAERDLAKLDLKPGNKPIDVFLWKTFFNKYIKSRPFIRLGATCILENIADKSRETILKLIEGSPELNGGNTNFLRIHMHDPSLPHGEEVLDEINKIKKDQNEMDDLILGAQIGSKIYLQLVDWIIEGKE